MDISKMTPVEMERHLRETRDAGGAETMSSNQSVALGYTNGCFRLWWSADNIGDYDWVGIYENDDKPDDYYLANHWQWASKSSPYDTSLELHAGYQARYLVYDYSIKRYVSVARTNPFPPINVRVYR